MNKSLLSLIVLALCLLCVPAFSQTENDTTLLGLPGDNLDLYAVLDLFQKSKTIEDFEKTLNEEKTGINNHRLFRCRILPVEQHLHTCRRDPRHDIQ